MVQWHPDSRTPDAVPVDRPFATRYPTRDSVTKRPLRAGGSSVYRALTIAVAAASLLTAGCAGMWDAVTSRRFLDEPFKTVGKVISPDDPMVVLRADPPRAGDEIAKAMHRLKEPIHNKGTQEDQDWIVDLLSRAATTDNSPVLRYAAISALGRFDDPRTASILVLAYQNAEGPKIGPKPLTNNVVQIGGTSAGRSPTRSGSELWDLKNGPTGFPADTVAAAAVPVPGVARPDAQGRSGAVPRGGGRRVWGGRGARWQ